VIFFQVFSPEQFTHRFPISVNVMRWVFSFVTVFGLDVCVPTLLKANTPPPQCADVFFPSLSVCDSGVFESTQPQSAFLWMLVGYLFIPLLVDFLTLPEPIYLGLFCCPSFCLLPLQPLLFLGDSKTKFLPLRVPRQ